MKSTINSSFSDVNSITKKEIDNNKIKIYELSKLTIKKNILFKGNVRKFNINSIKKYFDIYYLINISCLLVYYLCSKGCPYEIAVCVDDYWQKIYYIEVLCISIIGLIISLEFTLIIINLKGFKHIIYNIISYAIMFIFVGNGKTFSNHGRINIYIFLSVFLLFFILFLVIAVLTKLTLKYTYTKNMIYIIYYIITIR